MKEWRLLSIVFLILSIGLISLAYPVANAFNIPELKAWADVELSEAFSTVLIVICVIAALIFVELTTQAILLGSDQFDCPSDTYCPVGVAQQYIGEYKEKSMAVYGDIMENSLEAGKLAGMSIVFGTNYIWLLYASFSMKVAPEFMIDVTTATQEMQFLLGMRDALLFQEFALKHISGLLAPVALLLGIIFRTFFVTRKLGGLLIAFGVGFLVVFPATYALAFYTLQTTLYGSSTTGGDISNQFCTVSCRELPPLAYKEGTETTYTLREDIKEALPQGSMTDDEYKIYIEEFLAGEHCWKTITEIWTDDDGLECEEGDDDCYNLRNESVEHCSPVDTKHSSSLGGNIVSCGAVSYRDCPATCRSLPYPNTNPECASRYTEYMCREIVRHQCFKTRYADMDDPALGGLLDEDSGANGECPESCRSMPGLKKTGCDIGYGFKYSGEDMRVGDITEQMDEMGYDGQGVHSRCKNRYDNEAIGEIFANLFCEEGDGAKRALTWLGYDDLKEDGTVAWKEGCPNECRWVTTTGEMGIGCDRFCTKEPSNPFTLWQSAKFAVEDGDMDEAIAIAQESCYTIIPSDAMTDPECTGCSYLLDPGFASYPPVHQRCDNLCGKAKMVGVSKKSGSTVAIDGFDGPGEMKAITKLVVPAIVLPLLNLVITFMFIRTLSPILGGDVDIPGMTGLMK